MQKEMEERVCIQNHLSIRYVQLMTFIDKMRPLAPSGML